METLDKTQMEKVFRSLFSDGIAAIPKFIPQKWVGYALAEINDLELKPAVETSDKVTQKFARIGFRRCPEGAIGLKKISEIVESQVRAFGLFLPPIYNWTIRDIVAQRYQYGDYLSAHKDLSRHPLVIAIVNLEGEGLFELLDSRDGEVTKQIIDRPGGLTLLRGSGLWGISNLDDRPFHSVKNTANDIYPYPRTSLTFRDNTHPDRPIPGFSYEDQEA